MTVFTITNVVQENELYGVLCKLEEIESELECPVWMLGSEYRFWLLSMQNKLVVDKKKLDKNGYDC